MSQLADIAVYDGAATPVLHTLKAVSVNSSNGTVEALWRENLTSVPTEAQVSASVKLKKLPSGVVQVETRVSVPVMESVSGANAAGYTAAPKVAYTDQIAVISYQHPRSTTTTKRLARQIMANLLNNVSTSVAAATSGPIPEAVDSQFMPT